MEAIVLYPFPGRGHLISMVELGKLILNHYPSFNINILITTPPFNFESTAAYISAVSATTPSIAFHHLPTISLDPSSYPNIEALMADIIHLNNPNVEAVIQSIPLVKCLIIDLFCTPALDISSKLKIPTYYFFTSGVSCLALFLHLPTLAKNTTGSFREVDVVYKLPSLPPIHSSHMPEPLLDRNGAAYAYTMYCTANLPRSAGIIINTYESLEPKAFKAVSEGTCVPDGPTPPIFCIGPLIATPDSTGKVHECLTWLDSQPSRSVVFLCFGSLGSFSDQQLQEIAIGLEKSGQRFLWVVRDPPSENKTKGLLVKSDPDLNSLLPDGFLDRTMDRGYILKSWVPQVAVLSHQSVGGFVTHCGWNSVLESICAGVPMVAWPLYAEQRFNKILLVDELELAMPIMESEDGWVSSAEVEKRVSELIESEAGKAVEKRVIEKCSEAVAALRNDGSSRVALAKLVELWFVDA